MGRPIEGYKVDLSHQEVERLLEELDEVCKHTPAEWITAEAAASWLCHDQGYEDMNEFEDALKGTFEEFLKAMPHIETKLDDRSRVVFRIKPEPPQEQWVSRKMTIEISEGKDLWNVLMKGPYATVEIPELEFEISADGKRKIDTIYNHITSAVFNLGTHVRTTGAGMIEEHKGKIMETLADLNALLDVPHPWTLVVHDPSGLSTFSDMDKVEMSDLHPDRMIVRMPPPADE